MHAEKVTEISKNLKIRTKSEYSAVFYHTLIWVILKLV